MTDNNQNTVRGVTVPGTNPGSFAPHNHSDPEQQLVEATSKTPEKIAAYIADYDEAQAEYAKVNETYGADSDEAYEDWEDFRTDNAARARDLLETAAAELAQAQAALAATQAELAEQKAKYEIPEEIRTAIEKDFDEEPTLFVPDSGHYGGGYIDVLAYVDGKPAVKYTYDPEDGLSTV